MELTVEQKYRQTEAGIMPEDWLVKRLGDIGYFKNGINKAAEEFGFGLPFVNLMDVFGKPSISAGVELGLINSNDVERRQYNLVEGDVLFIRSSVKPSGVGLTSVVTTDLEETVFSGFLIRFRDDGTLTTEFKEHCFYSNRFRRDLIANSTVSANANINQDALKGLFVAVPPTKEEQTAIATALSDTDTLITGLEKLIEKKRLIKQGTMQELLRPKEGWEVKTLGELSERIVGGGTPSRANPDFWKGELPWVTVKDFTSFNPYGTQEYITKAGLINSATNLIPKGTLIICTRIALGRAVRYKVDTCINQDLKAVFLRDNVDAEFLNYWFEQNASTIQEMGNGSTVMGVSLPDLKKMLIAIPSISEQRHMAFMLSEIDGEISALGRKLAKQKEIKQGMMQVLLTGKVRLV